MEIITINKTDALFPAAFRAIGEECPAQIYAMGNLALLTREKKVAIIGARRASRQGAAKAYELGVRYAREGYVVVSGLALGCDAAAHRGCLDAGGETIAIVGSGLNIVHPAENTPLQEAILRSGGLVISEQPLGTEAAPRLLVARNRLQAALSDAVVVAECPEHSGTMHTVRFAQAYGKPVRAVRYPVVGAFNTGNALIINTGIGTAL